MVDFGDYLDSIPEEKKLHPIEIYDTLDRKSETGPLRPAQIEILNEWFDKRAQDRDLIVKLHTGEGKTLIGLLALQSRINSHQERCLYVCPNVYLVQQVLDEANKFGIACCTFEKNGPIPVEFENGEAILVTHVQKVFNGKTVFQTGTKSVHVDNVILDDAHACVESIRDAFTIRIDRTTSLFTQLIELHSDSLEAQGMGSFMEIQEGSSDTLLPIPYWSWLDKIRETSQYLHDSATDKSIAFAWPLIKDSLEQCRAFVTGRFIEISPTHIEIDKFGSLARARQRILMSATTQDDSFFIRGLDISLNAINSPLEPKGQKWSGERMILMPYEMHQTLDRDDLIEVLCRPDSRRTHGVIALVRSFNRARDYESCGALVCTAENLKDQLARLKEGHRDRVYVIVNRYDGINLPDDICRVLILDGLPYTTSLTDQYEESIRPNSDYINIRLAQRIEQGLGRSVRGEKDYCCTLLLGGDLIRFIRSERTRKYLSTQTQTQVAIGLRITEMAEKEIMAGKDPSEVLFGLIDQSVGRNVRWKGFYSSEMAKVKGTSFQPTGQGVLQIEKNAFQLASVGDNKGAIRIFQDLLDGGQLGPEDSAWYLQEIARLHYFRDKLESNRIQLAAYQRNRSLLKPRTGIEYEKLTAVNDTRTELIRKKLLKYGSHAEAMLDIESVLSALSFGVESDRFEQAMTELGRLLGFDAQRPDSEYKEGPDVLWCVGRSDYVIIECKNEVRETRPQITKHEANQMNAHSVWFREKYKDAECTCMMVIPTNVLGPAARFAEQVQILRKAGLRDLRNDVRRFYASLKKFELGSLHDELVHSHLEAHKLSVPDIKTRFAELPKTE